MGLSIALGMLAEIATTDPDGAAHFRAEFERINEVLAEHGLPPHAEPAELPPLENRSGLDSFPYSYLHTLRRAYAQRARDPRWMAARAPAAERAADDELVDEVSLEMKSHLLCHSDAEGFYLPVNFTEVIVDEERITGGLLGSSYRLREELIAVAPALGIRLAGGELSDAEAERINAVADAQGPLWKEWTVWLALYEAARLSIRHRAAICFT